MKGINLTLRVGPVVAVPVPQIVLDALTGVEITVGSGQRSGFQLTFNLSHQSPLHTIFLLSSGSPLPLMRVIISVMMKGRTEVLMDGVMTHHQVTPGSQPGQSTLTVTGEDLTALMDLIDMSGIPYPAMPPFARVGLILLKYAVLGVTPKVIPSVLLDVPIPVERIPSHRGTDWQYINSLADEVGYVFYITPGAKPGLNTAYWGPEIKTGSPQPALTMNMDAHTNVESLNFSFDNTSRTMPVVYIQNQLTKIPLPIPIPDITPLNPPLGAIPPLPNKFEPLNKTAKYSPVRATLIGLTKAAKSADALSAAGSLNVLRYGHILKARELVGVRGAGYAFDGLYYVKSVTHTIKRGEYKQNFTLSRNGLVSTVSKVPV